MSWSSNSIQLPVPIHITSQKQILPTKKIEGRSTSLEKFPVLPLPGAGDDRHRLQERLRCPSVPGGGGGGGSDGEARGRGGGDGGGLPPARRDPGRDPHRPVRAAGRSPQDHLHGHRVPRLPPRGRGRAPPQGPRRPRPRRGRPPRPPRRLRRPPPRRARREREAGEGEGHARLDGQEAGEELGKDAFKKQLMKSLSEDNLLQLSETGEDRDVDAENNGTARIPSWKDEVSSSHTSSNTSSRSTITESAQGYQFSITPYVAPKLTPGSTPIISSSSGSPLAYSTGPSTPKFYSGPTSPTRSRSEDQSAFSSWNGSSHQYSAPVSPQRRSFAGRPRIDGKEFFRQARTRLSYEQFGAFLANIKEFNAQKQSREDTLSKAEEIFGTEHKDLYISFQNMLNRNQS